MTQTLEDKPVMPVMSEGAKMVNVFLEPPAAFRAVAAQPARWWIPVVLITILNVIFVGLYSNRVGWERLIRQSLEHSSRARDLTPAQIEQAVQRGAQFGGIGGFGGAAVGTAIGSALIAGVLLLIINGLLGASLPFINSLAVVSYSTLTHGLYLVMAVIVMYIKSPDDFDLRDPLPLNVAAFLNPDTTPKWLTAVAGSLDLFSIWTVVLLAIGYAAASKKVKFQSALVCVAAGWFAYIVLKAGWAAVTG